MPAVGASRMVQAPADELWRVVSDPHHLPRWWPRVSRVEAVQEDAFTQVMVSSRGKVVRADFRVVRADESERTLVWHQLLEGTPFQRVLRSAEIELRLAAAGDAAATEVTIELRQELSGRRGGLLSGLIDIPRMGTMMVRRAAAATVESALDGLERISG